MDGAGLLNGEPFLGKAKAHMSNIKVWKTVDAFRLECPDKLKGSSRTVMLVEAPSSKARVAVTALGEAEALMKAGAL